MPAGDSPQHPLQALYAQVAGCAERCGAAGIAENIRLTAPPRGQAGDYATQAGFIMAPMLHCSPRNAAEQLAACLAHQSSIDEAVVAGAGFVNLTMSDEWYAAELAYIEAMGDQYGAGGADPAERVLVEFVSANPTGPLTLASGRHAAYGDALTRILAYRGHQVEREYYFNDAGRQIQMLGASVQARARGEAVPEDGYHGEYITELAAQIPHLASMEPGTAEAAAMEILMADIRGTLDRYGVQFDRYFSERDLHTAEGIDAAYDQLRKHDAVYERDGALWLRSSAYGDDQDRVLRRSDGSEGYLMADIAYFRHKRGRGHERCIDILGADHHGHSKKMAAAIAALGDDPSHFENPILQMVNLTEEGNVVKMGKRSGKFVTLAEVIDDIGVDTTRYFMLQRSGDSPIDIDLDLARQESTENPVHYIKYAHARAHSLLQAVASCQSDSLPLLHASEKRLIAECARWEEVVNRAACERAPHMVATYALELSQYFTSFYHECHVANALDAERAFRLRLVGVAKTRIATALDLLGIEAPDYMAKTAE